jgi:poly-gamma-glutamate capsule biosynthesis protein CapA/YwtB (metallophosphatase superfamily)
MRQERIKPSAGLGLWKLAIAGALVAAQWVLAMPSNAQPFISPRDPKTFNWRDMNKELNNKMTGTYTVAAMGDVLWRMPIGQRMSPQLRDVMRNADTTIGNLEGYIIDERNCADPCSFSGSWMPRDAAKGYADLGFDFLAPGEFYNGIAGHTSTVKHLAEVGIKMAGAGLNLTIARHPAFQELPQGRVAMVHACPGTNLCGPPATDASPTGAPARPGVNPLGLTIWNTVTAEQFAQLKAIQDSILARRGEPDVLIPSELPKDEPGRMKLLGTNYMIGERPGEFHYEVTPSDEQAQVLAVRNAKELADFVFFSMHVHLNRYAFQAYSQDNYPADFMRPLLHKLIDNGLDMFVGHGNHTMQGIEIYKGRPIFYNLGNIGASRYGGDYSPPNPENLTAMEREEPRRDYIQQQPNSEAFIGLSKYQDGKLVEVRIYPAVLGLVEQPLDKRRPLSRSSIPQTPSPEKAREMLMRIQKYSEPFGTKISIEDNIGVIRVPPEATAQIGGDLKIPGRGPDSRAARHE